jgi:DNA-directed RNA polymerase specialized sigma24 family protein
MPDDPQILADKALVAGVLAGLAEPVNALLAQAEARARRLIRRNFPAAQRDDLVNGFLEHLWREASSRPPPPSPSPPPPRGITRR